MANPSHDLVYQLHIQLAYIELPIWRRIVVSGQITLFGLHQMLQVDGQGEGGAILVQ